ncbi:GntR family transcriptional regulator [Microvirga sp. TS319]|uniref:GntR family transcriptional regulator n=1 Tax=Microvirga sp. TS319 TaxID=3241165 RepID=UPI00351A7AB1
MSGEPSNDVDERLTTADRILNQLSDAILRGQLQPGEKLSEPELARQLGTSRAPLREAISRLEERKLVTRAPHVGARVIELTPEKIQEIFVVREALEGMAAREAAIRISDAEIEQLRLILARHEAHLDESTFNIEDLQGDPDDDFHLFIVKCSRNETLINLLCGEYYNLIRLCRRRQRRIAGRVRRAFVEHRRIADALADRDAELAELTMRRHIAAARAGLSVSAAPGAASGASSSTSKHKPQR